MASTIHKKHAVSRDVYDLACERAVKCFKNFDTTVVWFSGGKDSTVALHVTLDAAKALNKLPLHVAFWDEEVIPPDTVDYCERVMRTQPVKFNWLCLPIKHRNACSSRFPWWYPFDPNCPELWARPIPEWGKTEKDFPLFERKSHLYGLGMIYPPDFGRVNAIMGVRTQESLNRYMAIASKTGHDAFMGGDHWRHITRAYPIYDWSHDDVWYFPQKFNTDYNRAYDVMAKAGIPVPHQRCAPPYGEQPLERLWTYHLCWPELWDKMVVRVPGAATAGRYARTSLYGYGSRGDMSKPDHMTWREFVTKKINEFPEIDRASVAAGISQVLDDHRVYTRDPIPDDEPHPESGFCWHNIAKLVIRGDIKGRKVIAMRAAARKRRDRNKESASSPRVGE